MGWHSHATRTVVENVQTDYLNVAINHFTASSHACTDASASLFSTFSPRWTIRLRRVTESVRDFQKGSLLADLAVTATKNLYVLPLVRLKPSISASSASSRSAIPRFRNACPNDHST